MITEIVTGSNPVIEEADDFDMQKLISASRREHLKTFTPTISEDQSKNEESKSKLVGGKSFDSLIMSESIFTSTSGNNKDEKESENWVGEDVGMEEEMSMTDANANANANDETEYDNLDQEAFIAEPLVRNGVASTLALLNMRGIDLKPRSNRSKTPQNQNNSPPSDIKLEYFDQFGNKLTSKEAYKELSRKFHGKGPGKGKLEKMKRRREDTLKMESVSASAASQSAIVTNLRRQQEETGAPYMILSSTRHVSESSASIISPTEEAKKPKIFGLQLKK